MKRHLLALLLVVFAIAAGNSNTALAQSGRYSIYAKIVDGITGQPLDMATVLLLNASDTTKAKYSSSGSNGSASISGITSGKYIFKVEYMGYRTYRKTVSVNGRSLDLGKIEMLENVNYVDELVITAVGNPIVVKKDTIEYSASSYKIADSDMLEDLLKKLPGVEVDSEGNITANGESITKVMIDGKTFFLDDPQLATKNLPANIIEKVKVVEKKSDQAEFTGIDDGEEEMVLDLSIKPGMLDGWFGNATAGYGYGNDHRFQAGLMTSRIKEDSQFTILLNGNNTNNRGFFDFAGNMMQSMRSMRQSGIRMENMFGGSGITTSWMGGINANKELFDGKLKLSGSYMYSGSDNETLTDQYKENFLESDSLLVNDDNSQSRTLNQSHMIGGEIDWKISDNTSILFKPQVNIGYGDYDESSSYSTGRGNSSYIGNVNEGYSRSNGYNNAIQAKGDLLLRHKFNKKGRTLSLFLRYEYSDNRSDAFNYSKTRLFGEDGMIADSSIIDQHYDLASSSSKIRARLSYTEPLGKDFYIEAAYAYSQNNSVSLKESWNMNKATGKYDLYDDDYSNRFDNLFINQSAEINLMQSKDKYMFVIGADMQPSLTKSVGDTSVLTRNVINFAPNATFEYRFSDNEDLRIRYRGRTEQPSITQLQPVLDNSDPLFISEGNPDLLPEFSHNLRIRYRFSDMQNYTMVFAALGASYTMDKIINQNWYDENGVQHSKPVNADGAYNVNGMVMANIPIGKSGFSISTRTSAGFNNGYSYISEVKNNVKSLNFSEWLRFMYRDDIIEAHLGGFARYNQAWYSVDTRNNPAAWTNSISAYLNVSLPWNINIKTDANYTFYLGYGEDYNDPSFVWNAEISKQFLKNKATLAIKVYDIMNQAKSVYRVTSDEYVMDVQTNALKRYVMLSFIYRFGDFGNNAGPRFGPPPRRR